MRVRKAPQAGAHPLPRRSPPCTWGRPKGSEGKPVRMERLRLMLLLQPRRIHPACTEVARHGTHAVKGGVGPFGAHGGHGGALLRRTCGGCAKSGSLSPQGRAAIRHAPPLAKRPVRAKRIFKAASTAAIPSSPESTPHKALTCPSATGPSIWPSRSVIL